MAKSQPYRDSLLAALQNPEEAAAYLDAALEAGDQEAFLLALRQVAEARLGSVGELTGRSGLNQKRLYQTLSEQANPQLASLEQLLHAMGLRLAVAVDEPASDETG